MFWLLPLLFATPAVAGDSSPVAYEVLDGRSIPDPLTPVSGDPARGAAIAAADGAGGCVICHGAGASVPGGPPPELAALAGEREPGALRLAIVNLGVRETATVGHAFYDVPGEQIGDRPPTTRLTAQDVEDLIAWIATLGD